MEEREPDNAGGMRGARLAENLEAKGAHLRCSSVPGDREGHSAAPPLRPRPLAARPLSAQCNAPPEQSEAPPTVSCPLTRGDSSSTLKLPRHALKQHRGGNIHKQTDESSSTGPSTWRGHEADEATCGSFLRSKGARGASAGWCCDSSETTASVSGAEIVKPSGGDVS